MIYRKENTTQEQLKSYISGGTVYYVGATINPDQRYGEHKRGGKEGVISFASTDNMKTAEKSLLDECETCKSNIQHGSNAQEKKGYVYTIKNP